MNQPSIMNHSFANMPMPKIDRSVFLRKFAHKGTADSGWLIPIMWDYVIPGDVYNVKSAIFARVNTPLAPIMDNIYVDTHWFYTPFSILQTNFTRLFGERTEPGDNISYLAPIIAAPAVTGWTAGSLYDYFGVPTEIAGLECTNYLGRAYNKIWNEFYRIPEIDDLAVVDLDEGSDDATDYVLLRRRKRHDYFTSCLLTPQAGTAISISLGSTAPVVHDGNLSLYDATSLVTHTFSGSNGSNTAYFNNPATGTHLLEYSSGLEVDLSGATPSTINELREAFALQRLAEADIRGGTRFADLLRSHFAVSDPLEAVLSRPMFLGGSTARVMFTPVPQTSKTDGTAYLGELAATGQFVDTDGGFSHAFTQPGVVMAIMSIRADQTYQYGLHRDLQKRSRDQFYFPELAFLGEQEVLTGEIFADGTANDDVVFGYQERWAEMRYGKSIISGQLRSNHATSLDFWHLGQELAAAPSLDDTFLEENPDLDRCVSAPTEPHVIFDAYIEMRCVRSMPTYSVPGMGGYL